MPRYKNDDEAPHGGEAASSRERAPVRAQLLAKIPSKEDDGENEEERNRGGGTRRNQGRKVENADTQEAPGLRATGSMKKGKKELEQLEARGNKGKRRAVVRPNMRKRTARKERRGRL
jgi:hypothetical protein